MGRRLTRRESALHGSIFGHLEDLNVEPDQRLQRALEIAFAETSPLLDSHVFHALLRLDTRVAWHAKVEEAIERIGRSSYRSWLWLQGEGPRRNTKETSLELATANITLDHVLTRALAIRRDPRTLGSNDFLRAIAELAEKFPQPKKGINLARPHTVDLLCELLDGERHTDFRDAPLTREVVEFFSTAGGADDFQLLLSIESGRIVLRPYTVLGDFVVRQSDRLVTPNRALLSDLKGLLGAFEPDEVDELENLLNDPSAGELQFQRFFEHHPHFFRRWDHREVHPHVVLQRETGNLIPDFLLTDREAQKAAIVELKLPTTIVRRQQNRDRFATSVIEARAQLLRYRDWFEDPGNRQRLLPQLGMEVFRPRLAVIIGRSSDFVDAIDRQRLASDNPDIEVVTYDEILTYAKRRRVLLENVRRDTP